MGAKIHLYPLERFIFGDDDYYDIDYFDGLIYQTAKIKGSTIKAGIISGLPSVDTIYNADGVITGTRTIDADGNFLTFDNVTNLRFNTQGAPFGVSGFEINANPTGNLFTVKNASTGVVVLKVSQNAVQINNAYILPTTDGTNGQVLTTNGAGVLGWSTNGAGDMLQSQYDPNNSGVVLSARKITVEFVNKTGATLTKGTIVYLKSSSASGTHPEALKADATTEATSSKTIGAVFEDTLNDAIGKIVTSGEVDNLDTSAFTIGTKLWLSTTPGQVTATPPTQPNHTVFIGTVTRSQNGNGRILYTIQNGYELDELHDVLISGLANGQVLTYDSITQLWKNQALPAPSWTPPDVNLFDGLGSGGLTTAVNAGAGYNRYFNGTGTAGRLSFNVNLYNNGLAYNGQNIVVKIQSQLFNVNSGGNVSWSVIYKFVTANGTTNAETGATVITTLVNVTGRTANFLYEDTLATINGPVGSDLLMISFVRNTGGGTNSDVVDAIGIKLQ